VRNDGLKREGEGDVMSLWSGEKLHLRQAVRRRAKRHEKRRTTRGPPVRIALDTPPPPPPTAVAMSFTRLTGLSFACFWQSNSSASGARGAEGITQLRLELLSTPKFRMQWSLGAVCVSEPSGFFSAAPEFLRANRPFSATIDRGKKRHEMCWSVSGLVLKPYSSSK